MVISPAIHHRLGDDNIRNYALDSPTSIDGDGGETCCCWLAVICICYNVREPGRAGRTRVAFSNSWNSVDGSRESPPSICYLLDGRWTSSPAFLSYIFYPMNGQNGKKSRSRTGISQLQLSIKHRSASSHLQLKRRKTHRSIIIPSVRSGWESRGVGLGRQESTSSRHDIIET